jgi:preprotein translocase subunit SecF
MSVKPLPGTHTTSAASLMQVESEIRETFRAQRPTGDDMVLNANLVGPLVAREMRQSTLRAAGLAMAAIFLYIAVRFRRRRAFGWVAVVTLAHDVMITLGLLLLAGVMGWGPGQVDLKVAAALLTTMGYSLNDTIVIFDRIREQAGEGPVSPAIVNTSINRVLLRTLITSATTLLVVGALLVFGGQVLRGFAFTLLVGVVVGTYSSLFIAGPMVSRPSAAS